MIVKKAVPGEWGIGSPSDAMLQHTRLPLLVVQADAVRTIGRVQPRSERGGGPVTSPAAEDQVRKTWSATGGLNVKLGLGVRATLYGSCLQ